jgi:hypothetical protein
VRGFFEFCARERAHGAWGFHGRRLPRSVRAIWIRQTTARQRARADARCRRRCQNWVFVSGPRAGDCLAASLQRSPVVDSNRLASAHRETDWISSCSLRVELPGAPPETPACSRRSDGPGEPRSSHKSTRKLRLSYVATRQASTRIGRIPCSAYGRQCVRIVARSQSSRIDSRVRQGRRVGESDLRSNPWKPGSLPQQSSTPNRINVSTDPSQPPLFVIVTTGATV